MVLPRIFYLDYLVLVVDNLNVYSGNPGNLRQHGVFTHFINLVLLLIETFKRRIEISIICI